MSLGVGWGEVRFGLTCSRHCCALGGRVEVEDEVLVVGE